MLKGLNDTKAGVGAVVKVLNDSPVPISAGTISKKIGVSTARTAVLLKKMSAKNLIVKETDKKDKRKTLVKLSEHGKKTADKMKENLFRHIAFIIDTLGMEKLEQFISLSKEIRSVILNNLPPPPEFDE